MSTIRLNYDTHLDLSRMENPLGEVSEFFDLPASDLTNISESTSDELLAHFRTFVFGGSEPTTTHNVQFSGSHVRILEALMRQSGSSVTSWRYVTPIVPDISYTNASPYKNDFIKSAIRTGHLSMFVDDISGDTVENDFVLNLIANPSVPTGYLYEWQDIVDFIATVPNDGIFIIDETYLPFCGEHWHDYSLHSHIDDAEIVAAKGRGVKIAIVCDWTKFFPSAGKCFMTSATILTNAWSMAIQLTQSKWPVSDLSKLYLKHCFANTTYEAQTHLYVGMWRSLIVAQLQLIVPRWTFRGDEWVPWIWIRADNDEAIPRLYGKLLVEGITVLRGQRIGGDSHCMCIMVEKGDTLREFYTTFGRYALEVPLGLNFTNFRSLISSMFEDIETISVPAEKIIPHKHTSMIAFTKYTDLYEQRKAENPGESLPNIARISSKGVVPIIVSVIYVGMEQKYMIIDGHSRYKAMKLWWNGDEIPVHIVDYTDPNIFANAIERLPYTSPNPNERNFDEKNVILSTVNASELLPATRNAHQIMCAGHLFPIHIITIIFN